MDKLTWQSIDTAPKDGTSILAYGTFCEGSDILIWWVTAWAVTPGANLVEVEPGLYRKETMEGWGHPPCCFHPTHWMPLPDPPPIPDELDLAIAEQRAKQEAA